LHEIAKIKLVAFNQKQFIVVQNYQQIKLSLSWLFFILEVVFYYFHRLFVDCLWIFWKIGSPVERRADPQPGNREKWAMAARALLNKIYRFAKWHCLMLPVGYHPLWSTSCFFEHFHLLSVHSGWQASAKHYIFRQGYFVNCFSVNQCFCCRWTLQWGCKISFHLFFISKRAMQEDDCRDK